MTAASTFETMEASWRSYAKGTNNIYGKYAEHLALYYKKWRKNRSRRDAVRATRASDLTSALEHAPPAGLKSGFVESPAAIDGITVEATTTTTTAAAAAKDDGANVLEDDAAAKPSSSSAPPVVPPPLAPAMAVPTFLPQVLRPTTPFYGQMPPFVGVSGSRINPFPLPLQRGASQKARKKRKTCRVPGCTNPDECNGGFYRASCPFATFDSQKQARTRTCRVPNCPSPQTCPGRGDRRMCLGLTE